MPHNAKRRLAGPVKTPKAQQFSLITHYSILPIFQHSIDFFYSHLCHSCHCKPVFFSQSDSNLLSKKPFNFSKSRFHPGRYSYLSTSSRKGTTSPNFSLGR